MEIISFFFLPTSSSMTGYPRLGGVGGGAFAKIKKKS